MVFGFLKNMLGGSGSSEPETYAGAESVEHEGYVIQPTPQKDPAGWRVMGIITREVDGEVRSHTFIRADVNADLDSIVEMTVMKARRTIDEQGERIFEPR